MRTRLRVIWRLIKEAWETRGWPKPHFVQIRHLRWAVILGENDCLYQEVRGKPEPLNDICRDLLERSQPAAAVVRLLTDLLGIRQILSNQDQKRLLWGRDFQSSFGDKVQFLDDLTIVVGCHYRITAVPEKGYVTKGPFGIKVRVHVFDATITRAVPDTVEFEGEEDEESEVVRLKVDTTESGRLSLMAIQRPVGQSVEKEE